MRDRERRMFGPFVVTPLLVDHSAFDAHPLLVEAGGRRLLYSGDAQTAGLAVAPRRAASGCVRPAP